MTVVDATTSGVPTVGHVMRAYLARTETFVRNQMTTLERYHPVVAAHHRRPVSDFPLTDGLIASDTLGPLTGVTDRLAYRVLKVASPASVSVLERYLREKDARLLHYHYLTDARFLLKLQARTKLPAIVSAYGYDVSSFPRQWANLGRRYLRPIFDCLDCFLAMTEDMRQDLLALGCPDDKIRVHYYGSDTRRFTHRSRTYDERRPLTILSCARLQVAKGQHLVLDALDRVQAQGGVDFRVVFVGDGPARAALERQVARLDWRERVTFAGHVAYTSPDLVEHFCEADIFVHPSYTLKGLKEGIPGTIVEAMAAGLPVVATFHAGIPAVVTPYQEGLLVPERNVDELARALRTLLCDAPLRARLGRAAAERARTHLDLRPRTRALERIYDEFV